MRTPGKRRVMRLLVQQMADKGEAARFAAQRTGANPQKIDSDGLKVSRVEIADQNLALLAAVLVDRLDQIAAQMLRGR